MSGALNNIPLRSLAMIMIVALGFRAHVVAQQASVRLVIPPKLTFFDERDVQLLPGPFLDARTRTREYLLAIDSDRLLHTFRLNAGLSSSATPYGGWEAPEVELRGHSLGHYLTACSRMFAASSDERFRRRVDALVEELEKVQIALQENGSNPGYLSAFPESFIDRVETRKPVWAPYYTLHKIMAGFLDAHEFCSNAAALRVLKRMADWVDGRMSRLDREQQQRMLQTEFGGMAEVLARLALLTREPRYLHLAQSFDHEAVLGPLRRGNDSLDGLHGNTQIPKLIGAVVEYELTGDRTYLSAARFFWDRVARHRSFVIGGNTNDEHFFPVSQFSYQRGPASTETCNSYNMIRLSAALFAHEPSAGTMDFVERALYNHILASQDPSTGMMCYYVSMKPGAYKTFSTPDSSFWCCVGTGMENPVRTVETVYAHDAQTLYVNLFIPSVVTWQALGVSVQQDTKFPNAESSSLTVHTASPRRFSLAVRHPAWAGDGFRIQVNGLTERTTSMPGSYAMIDRTWKDGDVVNVVLPMQVSMESMPDDPSVVAFLHGPIVLAGDLGVEGMNGVREYGPEGPDNGRIQTNVPALVVDNRDAVLQRITPDEERPGCFKTSGIGIPGDVSLVPFYLLFHRYYSVTWDLLNADQWTQRVAREGKAAELRTDMERRTIDMVRTDQPASEQVHRLRSDRSSNHWYDGRRSRHAFAGSFGYTLASNPAGSVTLVCRYQGNDGRPRAFDVLVNDSVVASEDFASATPGFFERSYPLPYELTRSRDSLSVTFRAHADRLTGAVFELSTLR